MKYKLQILNKRNKGYKKLSTKTNRNETGESLIPAFFIKKKRSGYKTGSPKFIK